MSKFTLAILASTLLAGSALAAQDLDLTGDWQGTLQAAPSASQSASQSSPTHLKDQRMILVIARESGSLQARLYSIDEAPIPFRVSSFAQDANGGQTTQIKFTIDQNGTTYRGTLNAAQTSITGTWTQGVVSTPLTFSRATPQTAWAIPAPPPPRQPMPADADPAFEVATIKPNDSGAAGMQALTFRGRNFITVNSSLADLIMFAYSVQKKQITGAPDWIEKDRYDIDATPDHEGTPSADQVRVMIRKLLADRFQLKFHHDQRELSAFVLTVARDGARLKPGQTNGNLHGIGMQAAPSGALLFANNAPIPAFTSFLQSLVLDRPVVDHTGLTGRYDITVTFTPDDSLFNGHPPQYPKPADGVEPAPGFFDALQQQLGLKLTPEKTQVDVLAIDHVSKPSAN